MGILCWNTFTKTSIKMKFCTFLLTICLQVHQYMMAGMQDCGVDISKRPTIEQVAGTNSTSVEQPWSVVIIREDNSVHCSASIIAPNLLLTAGHCFATDSDNYIPKNKLRVVFGLNDLNLLNEDFIP